MSTQYPSGVVGPSVVVKNYLGNTLISTDTIYKYVAYWDYPSPRLRPKPLNTTRAFLIRQEHNFNVYTLGSRRGRAGFVYGSYPTTIVEKRGDDKTNKLLSKFGSSDLDLGVTLAELDQTASMVSKRILDLIAILKALREKNWEALRDKFGIVISRRKQKQARWIPPERVPASLWLEWHLGWKQLASDIYAAIDAYAKGIRTRGSVVSSRVNSVPMEERRNRRNKGRSDPYFMGGLDDGGTLVSAGRIYGRVKNPSLRTLGELGLLNPAVIAWEKVPLSFVFDWLIPVGDILRATTAGAGMYDVRGHITIETRRSTVFASGPPKGLVLLRQRRFDRYPVTGPVLPFVNVNISSVERIATAMALLGTRQFR